MGGDRSGEETASAVVAACSRPLSQRLMLRTAAISCCLGDSPGAVPNCVSWRLADCRRLPCDDPPSLSRYGSRRVPKRSAGPWRARCRALRASKALEAADAALLVHPSRSAPVRRWRAAARTTGTFLVLLVYGPLSIGVIRAQVGVSRGGGGC